MLHLSHVEILGGAASISPAAQCHHDGPNAPMSSARNSVARTFCQKGGFPCYGRVCIFVDTLVVIFTGSAPFAGGPTAWPSNWTPGPSQGWPCVGVAAERGPDTCPRLRVLLRVRRLPSAGLEKKTGALGGPVRALVLYPRSRSPQLPGRPIQDGQSGRAASLPGADDGRRKAHFGHGGFPAADVSKGLSPPAPSGDEGGGTFWTAPSRLVPRPRKPGLRGTERTCHAPACACPLSFGALDCAGARARIRATHAPSPRLARGLLNPTQSC